MGITYRDAGVDIEAGDALVERIAPLAKSTATKNVLGGVGGFASLVGIPDDIKDPVLVSGTDGVGTKLKLAFELGRHDTVGIDLVAMCVNDIITTGARPLFFLDYFATGKLDVDQAESVVRGIAEGCRQARCALVGGETAELPGFYDRGEYDLAGFAVGVASRSAIIDGQSVKPGDSVIGLMSSGLHSNGYSLARRVLQGEGKLDLSQTEADGSSLGDTLLRPTRIYVAAVQAAMKASPIKAMSHITGGGLVGNIPRVLPGGMGARLDPTSWHRPRIFDQIQEIGDVPEEEMRKTFNLGIGFVLVVDQTQTATVLDALNGARFGDAGESAGAAVIGTIVDEAGIQFQ